MSLCAGEKGKPWRAPPHAPRDPRAWHEALATRVRARARVFTKFAAAAAAAASARQGQPARVARSARNARQRVFTKWFVAAAAAVRAACLGEQAFAKFAAAAAATRRGGVPKQNLGVLSTPNHMSSTLVGSWFVQGCQNDLVLI